MVVLMTHEEAPVTPLVKPMHNLSELSAPPVPYAGELVNAKIAVYLRRIWARATVVAFDAATGMHTIRLEQDGAVLSFSLGGGVRWKYSAGGPGVGAAFNPSYNASSPQREQAVGRKLRVFWPAMGRYYAGTVTAFNSASGMHRIDYKDGDFAEHDLRYEAVIWLAEGAPLVEDPVVHGSKGIRKRIGEENGAAKRARVMQPTTPRDEHSQHQQHRVEVEEEDTEEEDAAGRGEASLEMLKLTVNSRIAMSNDGGATYVRAKMSGYHPSDGRHRIRFDDNTQRLLNMRGKPFLWIAPRGQAAGYSARLHSVMCRLGATNVHPGGPCSRASPQPIHEGAIPGSTATMAPPAEFSREASAGPTSPEMAVGRRLAVLWLADGLWYPGEVLKHDAKTGQHLVLFCDGEDEWMDLRAEVLAWAPPQQQQPPPPRQQHACALPAVSGRGSAAPEGFSAVGWRVAVFWTSDSKFYPGLISSFDNVSGKHQIEYDDGSEVNITLASEKVVFKAPPSSVLAGVPMPTTAAVAASRARRGGGQGRLGRPTGVARPRPGERTRARASASRRGGGRGGRQQARGGRNRDRAVFESSSESPEEQDDEDDEEDDEEEVASEDSEGGSSDAEEEDEEDEVLSDQEQPDVMENIDGGLRQVAVRRPIKNAVAFGSPVQVARTQQVHTHNPYLLPQTQYQQHQHQQVQHRLLHQHQQSRFGGGSDMRLASPGSLHALPLLCDPSFPVTPPLEQPQAVASRGSSGGDAADGFSFPVPSPQQAAQAVPTGPSGGPAWGVALQSIQKKLQQASAAQRLSSQQQQGGAAMLPPPAPGRQQAVGAAPSLRPVSGSSASTSAPFASASPSAIGGLAVSSSGRPPLALPPSTARAPAAALPAVEAPLPVLHARLSALQAMLKYIQQGEDALSSAHSSRQQQQQAGRFQQQPLPRHPPAASTVGCPPAVPLPSPSTSAPGTTASGSPSPSARGIVVEIPMRCVLIAPTTARKTFKSGSLPPLDSPASTPTPPISSPSPLPSLDLEPATAPTLTPEPEPVASSQQEQRSALAPMCA